MNKKEAIAGHRAMWRWIGEETRKRKRCVDKLDYEEVMPEIGDLKNYCYLCEYASNIEHRYVFCQNCLVVWPGEGNPCKCMDSFYMSWLYAVIEGDWKEASAIALKIAELPEAEDV